jgi:hypothetical protein
VLLNILSYLDNGFKRRASGAQLPAAFRKIDEHSQDKGGSRVAQPLCGRYSPT